MIYQLTFHIFASTVLLKDGALSGIHVVMLLYSIQLRKFCLYKTDKNDCFWLKCLKELFRICFVTFFVITVAVVNLLKQVFVIKYCIICQKYLHFSVVAITSFCG